jgi:hypothetical protein
VRSQSIADQLAGKFGGTELGLSGPGGFSDPGSGFRSPLAGAFLVGLDADKNGQRTHDEFVNGFHKWFEAWSNNGGGVLNEDQLRVGIDNDLVLQLTGPGFPSGRTTFGR